MKRSFLLASAVALLACNADRPTSSSTPVAVKPGITWPASVDTSAVAQLGDENAKLVARSPVPVLVPSSRVDEPVLMVDAEYYAFSAKLERGAHLAIQGNRKAYRYGDIKPVKGDRKLRGGDGFIGMNEGIRTASFNENGAAYSVDVECSDHADERCAKEDFIVDVVNRLVYVGGSGR